MNTKIGIIGIVQEELQKDFGGTLKRLRELGYSGIELGFGSIEANGGADNVRKLLKVAGMELITLHTLREPLRDKFKEHGDALAATGCRHLTVSWAPTDSSDSINADAAFYNQIAPALNEAGVRLCYHHHDHEFRLQFGGIAALDLLLRQTTDSLALHADVAWAAFGGVDPVALIERHAGRIPIVHLKDLYDLSVRGCFTTVGTGKVDIRACCHAAMQAGVEWLSVEQDQPRGIGGFDLATASMLNLRNLGIAPCVDMSS